MSRVLKVLAILALLVTIAGAGLVLYGINTLAPVVEQATVTATPAIKAQEVFDAAMRQIEEGTFTGRVFGGTEHLSAENCTFLTYTVRLNNRGFFPAEWIALEIHPAGSAEEDGYDVLQLDNNGANVLYARGQGDLAATILHAGDLQQTQRSYTITCYVLGKQIIFSDTAGHVF